MILINQLKKYSMMFKGNSNKLFFLNVIFVSVLFPVYLFSEELWPALRIEMFLKFITILILGISIGGFVLGSIEMKNKERKPLLGLIGHVVLIMLFLINSYQESFGQSFSDRVVKNEKAIFQIFSYDEYGSPFSIGTGFFINDNGNALTNVHVLEDGKYAFIEDYSGEVYQIKEINKFCDPCDMAEIKIDMKGKKHSYLSVTEKIPQKGSEIFVIGNPEGFESTVSTGIISSIRDEENKVIQISAPISPGSSGSPIMDMEGNVIGIATYQYSQGQNLNFGYWIGCMDKLQENNKYSLSNDESGGFFVINQVCETDSQLILNSIELNEENTVVNFSYTNSSLTYGDDAFIYSEIDDKSKSFYIQDDISGQKYHVYKSTLGSSPKLPTYLNLGETKRFKLYFPKLPIGNIISIKEGMSGSDWSFHDIRLTNYNELKLEDDNFFNDFYYQTGLYYLSKKDFLNANLIFKDYTDSNNDNPHGHNLAGVVSYILGNELDAFMHINKAIEINPIDDNFYLNLYYMNYASGNFKEALNSMNSAISISEDSPEYYYYRGALHSEMELWKEAESDYSKFIESDREKTAGVYIERYFARTWLKNMEGACKDLEKAYDLANEEDKALIEEVYYKYCR